MKSLGIHNFRCFSELEVDFTPGTNLIIGDNASGKTSLLLACVYAYNTFFSGFSNYFTSWKFPGSNDFKRIVFNEKRLTSQPIEISFNFYNDDFDGWDSVYPEETRQTLLIRNEKSKPLLTPLSQLRNYGAWLQDNFIQKDAEDGLKQVFALPLFASFSTHGIHNSRVTLNKYFKEYRLAPSFGYYNCSSTDGLLSLWVKRLLIISEGALNPTELKGVLVALEDFFGPEGCNIFKKFDVRVNFRDVMCIFEDGREVPVELLSDGYKRLFSIVLDLAFRCALLNGDLYGVETSKRTRGTVVIDEIDLHLHPSLQAVVLKAFRHTFPNLQFIVSTHAPMVMSGIESDGHNSVSYMYYDTVSGLYNLEKVDTYGMDLSSIAEIILNVPSRDAVVGEKISEIESLIDNERYSEAKELLRLMKAKFGDRISELSGYETQILIEEGLNDSDS